MGIDKITNFNATNNDERIVFVDNNERKTDLFFFKLDAKLEEYRERMKNIIESGGDFENDPYYLDAKYKLFIGNYIRQRGRVKYSEIYNSLLAQDGGVKKELFDSAWNVIKYYANDEEDNLDEGPGFIGSGKEGGLESKIPVSIQCSHYEGKYVWREVYENSIKHKWHDTSISLIDETGKDYLLNSYLPGKFGENKKIESIPYEEDAINAYE